MQEFTSENLSHSSATAEQIGEPIFSRRPGRPKKQAENAVPAKRGRKPKAAKVTKRGKKQSVKAVLKRGAKVVKRGRRSAKDKLLGITDAALKTARKGRKPALAKAPKKVGRKLVKKTSKAAAARVSRSVLITLSAELGHFLARQADRYDMDIAGYVKHLIIKDMPVTRE